jgi:hypothetical protein
MRSDLQFTPELLRLWKRCRRLQIADPDGDELREAERELDRWLGLKPWEVGPLEVGAGPSPWPEGCGGGASWRPAQELCRRLDEAVRAPRARSPARTARARLDEDEKGVVTVYTPGRSSEQQ